MREREEKSLVGQRRSGEGGGKKYHAILGSSKTTLASGVGLVSAHFSKGITGHRQTGEGVQKRFWRGFYGIFFGII